jgi:hypothetical protein
MMAMEVVKPNAKKSCNDYSDYYTSNFACPKKIKTGKTKPNL